MKLETSQQAGVVDPTLISLLSVIERIAPERALPSWYEAPVSIGTPVDRNDLARAVGGLGSELADEYVDVDVVIRLLTGINGRFHDAAEREAMQAAVRAHVERRWAELHHGLVDATLAEHEPGRLLSVLPMLKTASSLHQSVARAVASKDLGADAIERLLPHVPPTGVAEARTLLAALMGRPRRGPLGDDPTSQTVMSAIGSGLEWSTWAALQTILVAQPVLAEPHATVERGDPSRVSRRLIAARSLIAEGVEPQIRVREVAAMLVELFDVSGHGRTGLLSRPAEVRAAFVEMLRTAIGDDRQLRGAAIEALLWHAEGKAADLAHFAAIALATAEDRALIVELERHPVSLVRYAARSIRAAKFGEQLEVHSLPAGSGLAGSLAALHVDDQGAQEPARTWIGDRAVERLIERTVATMELRFAKEYEDHGDEGEDRLLSSLFYGLALRFEDLEGVLAGLARAASAPYRASLAMRYRNIDRPEEGREGVRGAKKLAADMLLVVNPSIDGVSLGSRVTMIQAKRLYRDRKSKVQPAWHAAFRIDLEQRRALQRQTGSSVYFFHGPILGGRGVPVIPASLVADLSEHDGSGSQLATGRVAVASRSLADWLTYDALALRTGDPYSALVDRVEGKEGSLSRSLLDLPTVEVDVALVGREDHD